MPASECAISDDWVLSRRSARNRLDPFRPHAFLFEEERAGSGDIVGVATVLLTNRECPWRCVFCDLWKNTLTEPLPPGAIPAQMDHALSVLNNLGPTSPASGRSDPPGGPPARPLREIKLYNSGSFFDPHAIPPADHPAIAARVCGFERIVVECHPALVGDAILRFRDLVAEHAARRVPPSRERPVLEVAMGLEIAHPAVLAKLNKHLTLEQFARAAGFLRLHGIALRAFILVQPPFLTQAAEARHWARRSVDYAFDCGAAVAVLIPTRDGNGAMEELARAGQFVRPKLAALEDALDDAMALARGRVFADLWDLERFADCTACFPARARRLPEMNLQQRLLPRQGCAGCGAG